MNDILKGLIALACVTGAIRYGSKLMADKALANAKQGIQGFDFEANKLELPEFEVGENPAWTGGLYRPGSRD